MLIFQGVPNRMNDSCQLSHLEPHVAQLPTIYSVQTKTQKNNCSNETNQQKTHTVFFLEFGRKYTCKIRSKKKTKPLHSSPVFSSENVLIYLEDHPI